MSSSYNRYRGRGGGAGTQYSLSYMHGKGNSQHMSLSCYSSSSSAPDRAHAPHRPYFDKCVRNSNCVIHHEKEARDFLTAILEFTDTKEVVTRLTSSSEHGQKRLKEALQDHDDYANPEFVNKCVIPVLVRLTSEEVSRGVYKSLCMTIFYDLLLNAQEWLNQMLTLIERKQIHNPVPIGWIMLVVMKLSDERGKEARKYVQKYLVEQVVRAFGAQQTFSNCSSQVVEKLRCELTTILDLEGQSGSSSHRDGSVNKNCSSSSNGNRTNNVHSSSSSSSSSSSPFRSSPTMADLYDVPGGRHDNDAVNYRDIQIVPTCAELQCTEDPYLPMPDQAITEATMLDRNFRLLREEFVKPLREEINEIKQSQVNGAAQRSAKEHIKPKRKDKPTGPRRMFQGAKVIEYFAGGNKNQPPDTTIRQRRWSSKSYLVIAFAPPSPSYLQASWWLDHPRALGHQSLICLVRNGECLCFGTVWERDAHFLGQPEPSDRDYSLFFC